MALPTQVMKVRDAIAVAAAVARELGLAVDQPVPLRSTNNAVAWLQPANVVAKISVARHSRLQTELDIARELLALGGPVVAIAPELPNIVHCRGGLEMTFWQYHAQLPSAEPTPDQVALALRQLHAALARLPIAVRARLPSYLDELGEVRALLADGASLTAVNADDREMLVNSFERLKTRLDEVATTDRFLALHGAAHPHNVLLVAGAAVFIDFETICMGPVEWDLAHLDEQAEPLFRDLIHPQLLWLCRSMASVKTATLCAADIDRGDMREHAEWHLAHVRQHVAPRLR
jgi:Phosphotransferase enzyme family